MILLFKDYEVDLLNKKLQESPVFRSESPPRSSPMKYYQFDLNSLTEQNEDYCLKDLNFQSNLENLKHLCDGSHSHLYIGILRHELFLPLYNTKNGAKRGCWNCFSSSPKALSLLDENCVVIKRIKNTSASNKVAKQEFGRERKILTKLGHPNRVKIIGFGVDKSIHSHNLIIKNINCSQNLLDNFSGDFYFLALETYVYYYLFFIVHVNILLIIYA